MNLNFSFIKPDLSLIVGLSVICCFAISCNKNDDSGPEMVIKEEPIELTAENPTKSLLIANIGTGTLNWSMAGLPPWVKASSMDGELEPGPDEIIFTADLGYEAGEHKATINITSNGGDREVEVSFNQPEKDLTILPGLGLTDILLNDSYQQIREIIGEPDTIHHYLFDDPEVFYLHGGEYENLGLFLAFLNYKKSVIDPSDPLILIECFFPFDGTTEEGLGIGSSLDDIETVYGAAPDTSFVEINNNTSYEYFDYANRGIGFYFYNGDYGFAQSFDIYSPGNGAVRKRLQEKIRKTMTSE